jgi:hypothetical protein
MMLPARNKRGQPSRFRHTAGEDDLRLGAGGRTQFPALTRAYQARITKRRRNAGPVPRKNLMPDALSLCGFAKLIVS